MNEERQLSQCGWDGTDQDKLWRYNQHYFDDLNAFDSTARREWHRVLLGDWLGRNPPGEGTAWEPYPASLRIVNWIKWALRGEILEPALVDSLAAQARHLSRRLEYHLLGNHLFTNGKALVFAGLWFEGLESDRWRRTGFKILARETLEQILGDGGHFERSPMYHALALEDIIDLINLCRAYRNVLRPSELRLLASWERNSTRMRAWLRAMTHPDGGIAFFNDAAFGVAPQFDELEAYCSRLALPPPPPPGQFSWLADSGYARLEQPDAVLLCDMAPIGPDYLPGHAHADTLSSEFSLFGERVFVNSGTSVYGAGAERLRQRGTAAHSTVIVAAANSSEVWSGFRVGRRARPQGARVGREGAALVAECAHDGYRHLAGHPMHRRRWELSPGHLRVVDTLSSASQMAEARFHLHPEIQASVESSTSGRLTLSNGRSVSWSSESGAARLQASSYHPEFGVSFASQCLVVPLADGRSRLDLVWDG